jgi:hypothetical protein
VCIKSSRFVATDTAVERDLAPVSVVTAVLLSLELLRVSVLLPQGPSIPEIFHVCNVICSTHELGFHVP